jgi:CBS domain-containing protein
MLLCVPVALASAVLAGVLTQAVYRVEDCFARLPLHWMWWPALGGLVVGLGGLIEPRALGVGYDVIADLLNNHLVLSAALGLLLVKLIIWAVALGSGTSGGVLAPLLIIGAGLGSVLGTVLPGGDPRLWALVCMTATLGGTMRAPLTAVVFGFGLTHDVNAFLPSILSCAIAYGITVIAMPRSILTEKIARRGQHVFREYGVDPLERHFVAEVMTREPVAIPADLPVKEVLARYFGIEQRHRAYPLVRDGRLLGMLDRAVLSRASAEVRLEEPVHALSSFEPAALALASEPCRTVAWRMASEGLERLPVVDDLLTRRLVGIVSRSDLLKPVSRLHEEEMHRERLLRWGSSRPAAQAGVVGDPSGPELP